MAWTLPGFAINITAFPAAGAIAQHNDVLPALADEEGALLQLDASGRLIVTLAGAGGGLYQEDTAHVSGDWGVEMLARRADTPTSSSGTDGDYSTLNTDATGRLWVRGGSEYAEDTPHVSGDMGTQVLTRRADSPTSSAGTDGDYATLNTDGDGYVYGVSKAYDVATGADKNFPVSDLAARRTSAVSMISAPLIIDPSYDQSYAPISDGNADYMIDTRGYTRISLWVMWTHTDDATDVRFLMFGLPVPDLNYVHYVPILRPDTTTTPYQIKQAPETIHESPGGLTNMVFTWDLSNTIPYVVFMVAATTVAQGSRSTLTSAFYTLGWGS